MTDAQNFLEYSESLHKGVRWAGAEIGRRFVGVLAVLGNAVAQGATQVLVNRLPGHPDCATDARDQIGSDRELFRYRNEAEASWNERIREAWDAYSQGGTKQVILSEVESWGNAAFPGSWTSSQSLQEEGWASFTVTLPFGQVPWSVPYTYGSGRTYGSGDLYGLSNVDRVDLDHLKRLVRKWKPARSWGYIQILLADVSYWDDGTLWDDGSFWAGPSDILRIRV